MAETSRRLMFTSCSILMASLFAYSASVQLDDPDWYFWLPLYAAAAAINLLRIVSARKTVEMTAWAILVLGMILFLKVARENHASPAVAGFWSLDLRERVVREKVGSGLVTMSMLIHLKAPLVASQRKRTEIKRLNKGSREATAGGWIDYGMPVMVTVGYGLLCYFFKFVADDEMKKS